MRSDIGDVSLKCETEYRICEFEMSQQQAQKRHCTWPEVENFKQSLQLLRCGNGLGCENRRSFSAFYDI